MIIDCLYYRAKIKKADIVHFVALFRSIEDNIAFDRIEKPEASIFEFFVIFDGKNKFEEIMNLFLKEKIIINYQELPISQSSLHSYQY